MYAIKNHIKKFIGRDFDMYLFPWESNVISIGSIMVRSTPASKIWGTGVLDPTLPIAGGKVYALRGKLSYEVLKSKKNPLIRFQKKIAFGDPGMLISLFINPNEKLYDLGIVPHFSEADYFRERYQEKGLIIDLKSSDVERVTKEITSCRLILSTSLHGLIIAHTYGIPALWIEHEELHKGTSGFKFRDYFSSVDIPEYAPLHNFEELIANEQVRSDTFNNMCDFVLPHKDVKKIQRDLLNTAPFDIVEQYKV